LQTIEMADHIEEPIHYVLLSYRSGVVLQQ